MVQAANGTEQESLGNQISNAVGLDHCAPGEKYCIDDPEKETAMYKFPEESSDVLSEDDRNGLQALYGIYESPFPTEGKYSLSSDEKITAQQVFALRHEFGHGRDKEKFNISARKLMAFDYQQSGRPAREQLDEFFQTARANLSSSSTENLKLFKKMNIAGAIYADLWLKEGEEGRETPLDPELLKAALQHHLAMREEIIDILEGRP